MNNVCSTCRRQYRPVRIGAIAVEMKEDGITPYKMWSVDVHECPVCRHRILTGFANRPLMQEGQPYFVQTVSNELCNGALIFV